MADMAQELDSSSRTAVARGPEDGDAYGFFGTLVTIKAGARETGGAALITENLAPRGAGSPLHVHHNEDEWFYVLEGELTLWVGGEVHVLGAGGFAYGPRDIPHTFTVSSEQARFLLVTEPGGFEGFVRALGQSTQRREIPSAAGGPPDMDVLLATAADYGLEILGPPGIPA
jgi:quercetin dioxygenase-like cupin family protein